MMSTTALLEREVPFIVTRQQHWRTLASTLHPGPLHRPGLPPPPPPRVAHLARGVPDLAGGAAARRVHGPLYPAAAVALVAVVTPADVTAACVSHNGYMSRKTRKF